MEAVPWALGLEGGSNWGLPKGLCLKGQSSIAGVKVGPRVKGRGKKLELTLTEGGGGERVSLTPDWFYISSNFFSLSSLAPSFQFLSLIPGEGKRE